MRIRNLLFFLMVASATTASAHEQVYAHTHDSGLLASFMEMLFAAPPWAYAIVIVAVVALLRAIWKTS